jgi:uncharacterized protein (TIGR03083 family)
VNALIRLDERLDHIRADADRLATCLETGDLDSPVEACPGWDLRKLGVHTGFVHRWAAHAVRDAAPPDAGAIAEPRRDAAAAELGAWMREGASELAEILAATPPDAPTWHPFPADQLAWIWARRQMIETALHRWDAEVAVRGSSDLDSRVAATGIDECLDIGLPRVVNRESTSVPEASLHLHCTDTDLPSGAGEWILWSEDGEYRMATEHRKGDAAVRASAEHLLLALMGRADRAVLDIVGDPAAADAWLDLRFW